MASGTRARVELKCPQCGSECRWLDDVSTKVCLHCGYQEKLTDSDAVRKAQIAANKEIELAKLKEQKERREAKTAIMIFVGACIFGILGFLLLGLIMPLIRK